MGLRNEHAPLEGASKKVRASGKRHVRPGVKAVQGEAEATKTDGHIRIFLPMSKAHRKQLEVTSTGQIWVIFKYIYKKTLMHY